MNLLEKIRNQSLAVKLAVYAVFVILLFVSSGFLVGSVIGAFRFTTRIADIMKIGFVENIRLSAATTVAGCIIFLAMNGKRNRRNTIDYEYEANMARVNNQLNENLETICLITDKKYMDVSSSTIREIVSFGGDVSEFAPQCVIKYLEDIK